MCVLTSVQTSRLNSSLKPTRILKLWQKTGVCTHKCTHLYLYLCKIQHTLISCNTYQSPLRNSPVAVTSLPRQSVDTEYGTVRPRRKVRPREPNNRTWHQGLPVTEGLLDGQKHVGSKTSYFLSSRTCFKVCLSSSLDCTVPVSIQCGTLQRKTKVVRIYYRDHRKLGQQLDLFSINDSGGAGLVFWHPKVCFLPAFCFSIRVWRCP